MRMHLSHVVAAAVVACAALLPGHDASGDPAGNVAGPLAVYGNISPDQIEFISTAERIRSVAASGSMMAIWEALEHAERVECIDCISSVEPLLYEADPQTREIAAWWLRRRVFGVFGPGETYERTLKALASDGDAVRRADAASALGEFLAAPGAQALAAAVASDPDPRVRAAAASALGRMNDDGAGALGKAMSDADAHVKIAALGAAGRVSTFVDTASVARLTGDGDAIVRRRAVEVLDGLRVRDAVASVVPLAKSDPDANVRNAACHALGTFGDPSARATLEEVSKNDANGLVRDQALIALRRL